MIVTMKYENQEQQEKVIQRMRAQNLFVMKNMVIAPDSGTGGGELHIDMAVVPLPAQPAASSPSKDPNVRDVFWESYRHVMIKGSNDQKLAMMKIMLDAGWFDPHRIPEPTP